MLRTSDFRVYGDAWTQFMCLQCDCGHMGGKQWEDTRHTHTHTHIRTHTYRNKMSLTSDFTNTQISPII